MRYISKKYKNDEDKYISFMSSDDNIICNNGKYLKDNLSSINTEISKLPVDIAIVDNKLCAVDKTGKAIGTGLTADQVKTFLGLS